VSKDGNQIDVSSGRARHGNNLGALPAATASGQAFVTMPDWSPDGTSLLFVVPQTTVTWDQAEAADACPTCLRNDDDHVFGGSLYTMTYAPGTGSFGAPAVLLASTGCVGSGSSRDGRANRARLLQSNRRRTDLANR
jgi:hypothetical protein